MDFGVPPIGRPDPALLSRASGAPRSPEPSRADFSVSLGRELDGPPPALLTEVARAARRYEELRAMKRELHFEPNPETGRIVVEVRDLDGNLIRTVPPSEALEIAAGVAAP